VTAQAFTCVPHCGNCKAHDVPSSTAHSLKACASLQPAGASQHSKAAVQFSLQEPCDLQLTHALSSIHNQAKP
jgi:hypothetical protein